MKNIFYNSVIAKVLLYFSKCHTIMLCGFVFSKLTLGEMTQGTRNHECVHSRQWVEMTMLSGLIILALVLSLDISAWWLLLSGTTFYVWYILEWMCKGLWYSIMMDDWTCDMETPYEAVSLEREARIARDDSNYLENSKYFAWLKNI